VRQYGFHPDCRATRQNRRLWVRLREKGSKPHAMPCHQCLDVYRGRASRLSSFSARIILSARAGFCAHLRGTSAPSVPAVRPARNMNTSLYPFWPWVWVSGSRGTGGCAQTGRSPYVGLRNALERPFPESPPPLGGNFENAGMRQDTAAFCHSRAFRERISTGTCSWQISANFPFPGMGASRRERRQPEGLTRAEDEIERN